MKYLILNFLLAMPLFLGAQNEEKIIKWIGKPNRINNPGAEANVSSKPNFWQTDFPAAGESNWVSSYGTTSHEWNHGDKKLGIPPNAENNYFRLSVTRNEENRKINIYQKISLSDLQAYLQKDTVVAVFRFYVGSGYNTPKNCSFAEIRTIFYNQTGIAVDSFYMKRTPNEFRDLDAGTPEAEERGFNVMHELKMYAFSRMMRPDIVIAKVEAYCEFPCNKHIMEEDEESEGENANTFFFDNFMLGFYQK